jgi:hypothetical protein
MTDDCIELKNIKYQTMLLNNNSKIDSEKQDTIDIDKLLETDKKLNKSKPWSKIGKSTKSKKIKLFIKSFSIENGLKPGQVIKLTSYLMISLEKKKLQRTKDVIYNVSTGKITKIPGLIFNKVKNKFSLKRVDKKRSTLKGLAPKSNKKKKKKIRKDKTQKNIKK